MRFLIVIEKTRTGYSAYSPDLDGCIAAGRTRPSVLRAMRRAVELHLDGLAAAGRRRPQPSSDFAYVEVGGRSS
jgi:predicted RNase H-like HicB family nuclease